MTAELLASIEAFLLALGAFGAYRFTRFMAKENGRNVVLMAAVTAWSLLFGILPFLVFALLVGRAEAGGAGVGGLSSFVLNLIPFALVTGPVFGFVQGMVASRRGA